MTEYIYYTGTDTLWGLASAHAATGFRPPLSSRGLTRRPGCLLRSVTHTHTHTHTQGQIGRHTRTHKGPASNDRASEPESGRPTHT